MTNAPRPLVPESVDLRDFPYMPLDVARLRDSDTVSIIDAEAFRATLLLWCAAWHQVPAASLPDHEPTLARYAGYGRDLQSWRAVREEALRNWILCSDGRWYHPVVAEKAIEAWNKRIDYRDRLAHARAEKARKAAERATMQPSRNGASMTGSITGSITEPVTGLKGREGKGRLSTSSQLGRTRPVDNSDRTSAPLHSTAAELIAKLDSRR